MLHTKLTTEMLLFEWSRGWCVRGFRVISGFQCGVIRHLLRPQLLYSVKDVSLGLRVVQLRCSKSMQKKT